MDDLVRTVLIVLVILILLYFLIKWFSGKADKLTNLEEGTMKQVITTEDLPANNTSNYTFSIWFFVTDWNYKYSQPKSLLQSGISEETDGSLLSITMGAQSNDLNVEVLCYASADDAAAAQSAFADEQARQDALCPDDCKNAADGKCGKDGEPVSGCGGDGNYAVVPTSGTPITCQQLNESTLESDYSNWPLYTPVAPENGYEYEDASGIGINTITPRYLIDCSKCPKPGSDPARPSGDGSSTHKCTVKNFPLQKWVNAIVSLYGRTLDIYIDGKLVKTCVLPGPAVEGRGSVIVTDDGGFDGFTANLKYWPDATNPQEAYNIYRDGYGGGGGSDIWNKYKLKVAYLEDDVEKGSFEI